MLRCQVTGLAIGPKFGTGIRILARNQRTLDWEFAENGVHWNRNWPGFESGGLNYSPDC